METFNKFMVGGRGDGKITILNQAALGQPLTKEDAINLAAWLLCLADDLNQVEVTKALKAVMAS